MKDIKKCSMQIGLKEIDGDVELNEIFNMHHDNWVGEFY